MNTINPLNQLLQQKPKESIEAQKISEVQVAKNKAKAVKLLLKLSTSLEMSTGLYGQVDSIDYGIRTLED